jgi:hypothetical protein
MSSPIPQAASSDEEILTRITDRIAFHSISLSARRTNPLAN